jgi:hypothetical protein
MCQATWNSVNSESSPNSNYYYYIIYIYILLMFNLNIFFEKKIFLIGINKSFYKITNKIYLIN